MKTILSLASAACMLCSLSYATPIPTGLAGNITLTGTATVGAGGTYKENKTSEAHETAIDNNQNSTRTESYTAPVQKIGNREILQALLETDNVKGWSLIFVNTDGFEGLVAYKKGQPAIPVPEDLLQFSLSGFGGESALFSHKQSETFTAKNHTLKGTFEQNYIIRTDSLALFELELGGVDKGTFKVSWNEGELSEPTNLSVSGEMNVFGYDEVEIGFEVFVEAKISYSLKSGDVSAYTPAL
jgi:hypothetical protein